MIMYKTYKWSNKIEEIDVIKYTDKTVTYLRGRREDRENKVSSYHCWHETKEDAINHLKKQYLSEVSYAEERLLNSKKKLEELIKLYGISQSTT